MWNFCSQTINFEDFRLGLREKFGIHFYNGVILSVVSYFPCALCSSYCNHNSGGGWLQMSNLIVLSSHNNVILGHSLFESSQECVFNVLLMHCLFSTTIRTTKASKVRYVWRPWAHSQEWNMIRNFYMIRNSRMFPVYIFFLSEASNIPHWGEGKGSHICWK